MTDRGHHVPASSDSIGLLAGQCGTDSDAVFAAPPTWRPTGQAFHKQRIMRSNCPYSCVALCVGNVTDRVILPVKCNGVHAFNGYDVEGGEKEESGDVA